MELKAAGKLATDLVMTAGMLFLMAYSLVGEKGHEWVGTGIFLLFLLHHIWNGRWLRSLGQGRYSFRRIIQTAIVTLIFLCMIGDAVSGVVLSRYLFRGLPIRGGQSWARVAHLLCSYWGFVIMGIHLGLHWSMISNMVRKAAGWQPSKAQKILLGSAEAAVVIYGLIALRRSEMLSYLFLRTQFVFFDFDRPLALFFLDYLAMLAMIVLLTNWVDRYFIKRDSKNKEKRLRKN